MDQKVFVQHANKLFAEHEPLEITYLYRIYRRKGRKDDGKPCLYDPFYFSFGSAQRLSSERYGIKVGYWAPSPATCTVEVFMRHGSLEFLAKEHCDISLTQQHDYFIYNLELQEQQALRLVDFKLVNEICRSAIYSDCAEKDQFVKYCYEHLEEFDGIAYESNQERGHYCYALFERSRKKLVSNDNRFTDIALADAHATRCEIISDLGQLPNGRWRIAFEAHSNQF